MNKTIAAFQVILSVLSAILVCLTGFIGNSLSNILYDFFGNEPLPQLTEYVMVLFRLNNENFFLATFPFVVLFISIGVFCLLSEKVKDLFWYVFVAIWILFGIFIAIVINGLLLGFHILMTKLEEPHPAETLLISFNIVTIFLVIVCLIAVIFNKRKKQIEEEIKS